jgi:hypothetical protein
MTWSLSNQREEGATKNAGIALTTARRIITNSEPASRHKTTTD